MCKAAVAARSISYLVYARYRKDRFLPWFLNLFSFDFPVAACVAVAIIALSSKQMSRLCLSRYLASTRNSSRGIETA